MANPQSETSGDGPFGGEPSVFHRPYSNPETDFVYNLLFCDELELFRAPGRDSVEPWKTLLAPTPEGPGLERIANDASLEGRMRALAFKRLRETGHPVQAKVLLGVVVEVPLEEGLDVLAAFSEGGVRYINHSGKLSVFDGAPAEVKALAGGLLRAAKGLIDRIGPWQEKRLPPPSGNNVRISFLVSDGLYFGQGPYAAIRGDALGGPLLACAERLLQVAVRAAIDSGGRA